MHIPQRTRYRGAFLRARPPKRRPVRRRTSSISVNTLSSHNDFLLAVEQNRDVVLAQMKYLGMPMAESRTIYHDIMDFIAEDVQRKYSPEKYGKGEDGVRDFRAFLSGVARNILLEYRRVQSRSRRSTKTIFNSDSVEKAMYSQELHVPTESRGDNSLDFHRAFLISRIRLAKRALDPKKLIPSKQKPGPKDLPWFELVEQNISPREICQRLQLTTEEYNTIRKRVLGRVLEIVVGKELRNVPVRSLTEGQIMGREEPPVRRRIPKAEKLEQLIREYSEQYRRMH